MKQKLPEKCKNKEHKDKLALFSGCAAQVSVTLTIEITTKHAIFIDYNLFL